MNQSMDPENTAYSSNAAFNPRKLATGFEAGYVEIRKMENTKTEISGFTLIELMATIAVLGILKAIALPSYRDSQERWVGKWMDHHRRGGTLKSRHRAEPEYSNREPAANHENHA